MSNDIIELKGKKYQILATETRFHPNGLDPHIWLRIEPLPEPLPSLEEEVKAKLQIWHESHDELIVAICRVVDRRLLALKKGEA